MGYDDEDREDFYDPNRGEFGFADPGGRSALRASTGDRCFRCKRKVGTTASFCKHCGAGLNPRKFACPTCGATNRLTAQDKSLGYQCDRCADRAEGRCVGGDY